MDARPLVLLVCALFASCSTQAVLTLEPEGGLTLDTTLRLGPEARSAWSTLRELDPTLPADPLAPELLNRGLAKRGQATRAGDATAIHLATDRPGEFLASWKASETGWEATLDRAALRRWADLTSWSTSPALDSLLPAPGAKISEAEYGDLLVYLLGSAQSDARAKALVAASTVELKVVAPRVLQAAPGAEEVSGRTAVFRWPLTRLLTLDPPLRIRLVY